MKTPFRFQICFHDNAVVELYARNSEHALTVRKQMTYSMAPIRFIELVSAEGVDQYVNLSYVAMASYHYDEVGAA